MLEDILTLTRLVLLIAGVIAVAVWAVRSHDDDASLLKRLTKTSQRHPDK